MTITSNLKAPHTSDEVYKKTLSGYWTGFDPLAKNTLWGWGQNLSGSVGVNNLTNYSSPVQIPGTNWLCVSGGGCTNSALKTDNTLWVWGSANSGGLGNNNININASSPVQVPGTAWCFVTTGATQYTIYGIKTDNTLWAWGSGNFGLIPLNSSINRSSPVQIPGTAWCSVGCIGNNTGVALKNDGTMWVWGQWCDGLTGNCDAFSTTKSSPIQMPGTAWCKVGFDNHAMALKTDSTLWVWGNNFSGGLGQNNTIYRSSPVQVPGTWCDFSVGTSSYALKPDNTLWTWGCNNSGELALNDRVPRSSPVQIPGSWNKISAGSPLFGSAVIGIKTDNTAWAWGEANYGTLGLNDLIHKSSPVQLPGQWGFFSTGNQLPTFALKTL